MVEADQVNAVDVTPEKNGGVLKEILMEGYDEATPPNGVLVIVHYVGKLTDGTQFDSSRDRGEPFKFTLGKGQVIRGWDLGVSTMKKGEKCLLTCRHDYAYGAAGSPPTIPPSATLVFEVELLEWEAEDLSGKSNRGILRHLIDAGEGVESPKDLAQVDVTLVGSLKDGKEFFNERLSFSLGEGSKQGIPKGIEKALKKMTKNEKSKIELNSKYGFGSEGNQNLDVPPDSDLVYIVTLHGFEVLKDWWVLNSDEKFSRAETLKEKGTEHFKQANYHLAIKMYKKVVQLVECDGGFDGDLEEKRKNLLIAGYLNLAITYLKMENLTSCRDMCDKALGKDPKSVKALFRRGQAYLGLKEPELAMQDFKAVLEVEPNNKAAQSQVMVCQATARNIKQHQKQLYANMFDKFARKDQEKEEEKAKRETDVLEKVGEWGINERGHDPTDFEKENPNILMLNKDGQFKDM